jgi:hypothetical protein
MTVSNCGRFAQVGGTVDLTWVGCYLGGRPQGSCWQRLEGGAWLVGPTGGGPGTEEDSLLFSSC